MSSYSTPAASTASLVPRPSHKDYASAFANLQNSYGFGGAPVVTTQTPYRSSKNTSTKNTSTKQSSEQRTPVTPQPPAFTNAASQPQKDYSQAFATLQSSYGFGGAAPNPYTTPAQPSQFQSQSQSQSQSASSSNSLRNFFKSNSHSRSRSQDPNSPASLQVQYGLPVTPSLPRV